MTKILKQLTKFTTSLYQLFVSSSFDEEKEQRIIRTKIGFDISDTNENPIGGYFPFLTEFRSELNMGTCMIEKITLQKLFLKEGEELETGSVEEYIVKKWSSEIKHRTNQEVPLSGEEMGIDSIFYEIGSGKAFCVDTRFEVPCGAISKNHITRVITKFVNTNEDKPNFSISLDTFVTLNEKEFVPWQPGVNHQQLHDKLNSLLSKDTSSNSKIKLD